MIQTINEWEFVSDDNGKQFVQGHRETWSEIGTIYETSYVLYKIPLRDHFLVITENESIYRLPYHSSYW